MNLAVISFTLKGSMLNQKIVAVLQSEGNNCKAYALSNYAKECNLQQVTTSLSSWTGDMFIWADAIIFIGACGIAVRSIAPYIKDKLTDPAVLVLDEDGEFVISLLSGHMGGANQLALKLADNIGAKPVITTATDRNNKVAVDVLAKQNGLWIEDKKIIKDISAAVLHNQFVGFVSDFPVNGFIPKELSQEITGELGICVTIHNKFPFTKTLRLIPKIITLGIGCKRNTSYKQIKEVLDGALKLAGISMDCVKEIASIDLKKDEIGLIELANLYQLPFRIFSSEELNKAEGEFSNSQFVAQTVGVGNVCERAAVLACGGQLIQKKYAQNGVTIAIGKQEWSMNFE